MKSLVCVLSLLFSLAAGQVMNVCSGTESVGDYTVSFTTHNNSVIFTVSARTTRWVAVGVSNDTNMAATDIVLGATDGTDGFINDRYATAQSPPPVDSSQDITDTDITHENEFTTITFTRPRVSEDTQDDISLDQCRYLLWAWGGAVTDYTDPTSIGFHGNTNRGNFANRYCIPGDCVIQCPALDSPTNGMVDDTERVYQSVATYTCDSGFTLDGSMTRTCQSDGEWSGQPPTCVIVIQCPALDSPTNGTVDDTERVYQSVATYTCDSGFTLDGSMTRTCQSDGEWSGQPPTCVDDSDDDGAPVVQSSVMLTCLLAALGSSLAVLKF